MEPVSSGFLWSAVGEGRLSAVRQCIEAGIAVDEVFSEMMTPLHFAALQGHIDIVKYLVECGASVNKANNAGLTPLMSACAQGFIDVARFLVDSGADVNAVGISSESPILYLCKTRAKRIRTCATSGSMHLFYKMCHSEDTCGCLSLVQLLIDAGADVNIADSEGMTSLMGFVLSKHFAVAKLLIRSGADTNRATKNGVTALLLACRLKHSLELIEILLNAGTDVNLATSPEGSTPLMAACYGGTDNVEALIRAGASVNAVNYKGETALKCAVFATYPSVIETLIKAGIRIDKELILAVIIGHGECIQSLIINGALPRTHGSMLELKPDIEYLSRRFNVWTSNFVTHKLLAHLNDLGISSLTPFMVALMRKDNAVACFFVRNLFLHPLDISFLQDLKEKGSTLENDGLSPCFSLLVTKPWSLFSISFLCVSFAVGFGSDRAKRISLTGLPNPLQLRLLYRDNAAFIPVREWASLEVVM
uniref:Uncharacterized protein n=1 Tax=Arion vulgaris TaxID=1028688 RepID=A0A0B7ARK9_9EUPU